MDWSKEFSRISFGDKRLNQRFLKVLAAFSLRPGDTIAGACGLWSAAKGAYRLLNSKCFDREQVMDIHKEKTIERIKEHAVVLCIQDTSTLSYANDVEYLGNISKSNSKAVTSKGLMMHTLVAITPEMNPLGILDQIIWARGDKEQNIFGHEKESFRWIKSLESGSHVAMSAAKNTKIITISDRESDITSYLGAAYDSGCEVIVRARSTRLNILDGEKLPVSVGQLSSLGSYELEYEKRYAPKGNYKRKKKLKTSEAKKIAVEVRAGSVLIRGGSGKSVVFVPINCVYVREISAEKEALEWILLTSLEIRNFEEAKQVIEYYKARWFIEIFHRTLKSGCGVEESRLQTIPRLQNYLLLMSIAAIKICQMTYLQRSQPNASCEIVMTTSEWQALYLYSNAGKKLPGLPPTIHETTTWVAQLGGFLARKNDGYPGTLTIWKGLLRLNDIHRSFMAFRDNSYG